MTFLTREVLEELTHLTYKQVAEKLGVSLATIYYVSKSYGISFSKKRPSKEELEKLSHLNVYQIAEKYQVKISCVRLWARVYDLKFARKEKEDIIKPSKEELEKLTHLSQKQIAEFYGVTKQSVSLWGKEYGLTFLPTKGKVRKIPLPPREDLKNLSVNETATKYKVSVGTVVKWRRELDLGLKRPSKEELEKLSHLKQSEIAQILGVSQSLVSYLRIQYGIAKKYVKGKDK